MAPTGTTSSEAERLESLWRGAFGNDYVERNAGAYHDRGRFWGDIVQRTACDRVLEVGCNMGGNLQWLTELLEPSQVHGIDINHNALERLGQRLPQVNRMWGPARELPYRDRWFDLVFTMGVLIHQPDSTLPLVMGEMVRTSRRWVLCGEYHASETQEVAYRGHDGALFRRDYGSHFLELFGDLRLEATGFLGRDEGWDDVTWWLFERT